MHRYVIVGVDPGATVGIALLDLSGRKIASHSFSGGGISEAARFIEQHGTPSLVACDVSPAPEMALRLASYFSCKAYSPQKDIREEEKRKVATGAGLQNNHERDAYTAAVFAYRQNANSLRQIDALAELPVSDREKIKHLLLRGYRIRDAFLELTQPVEEKAVLPKQQAAVQNSQLSPDELRARASSLARENAHLRMLVARLEAEKRQMADRLRLLENGVRQTVLRDSELRKLRFQLGQTMQKLSSKEQWRKGAQGTRLPDGNPPQKTALSKEKEGMKSREGKEGEAQANRIRPAAAGENTGAKRGQQADGADLNNLTSPALDLERMVAEYRRGKR